MTSQISTRKLLKQELRQNGWMFGLTTLLHFLTGPVVFLLNTANYLNWNTSTARYRFTNFFASTFFFWQLFVMIICITMCIFIYRYLFSRRMVDLYHSVPISRGQLFLVKYLHGFLIWFLPFVFNIVSVSLLCALRFIGNPFLPTVLKTMLLSYVLLLICFFIFYHLFLVAVYLSGNVLNMFANAAIIGCSVFGLAYLFFTCADYFFDTYCYSPPLTFDDIIYCLSPFITPFGICTYFSGEDLFSEHLLMLALSILISILLLGLARALCRKRPSELAERGTTAKTYTFAARIIVTLLAGIGGSLFFSEIASNSEHFAWGIFGVLLCSVLGFGAINSIFNSTIKAFFKHKLQIVLVTLLGTFVMLSFHYDLFGYDTYLPDKEDIAGIAIYTHRLSDSSGFINMDENGQLGYVTTDLHVLQEEPVTDADLCYNMLNTFIYMNGEGSSTSYYVQIKLKNGRTYERRYTLADTQYAKIAPFIEAEEYKETNYKFSTGALGYPDELSVSLWDYRISAKISEDSIKELMDAYWQDFEEHYNLGELTSYLNVADISGSYYYEEQNNINFSVDVPDNYTRTLAVLAKLQPNYMPAVHSAADIKNICLYAPDLYEKENNIESLYKYFGYETAAEDDVSDERMAENMTDAAPQIVDAEQVEVKQYAPTMATNMELEIYDEETIQALYPLLYYGEYRDFYDRGEYVYIGYITTAKNYSIGVYTKPGTLPKELIGQLYETRQEYDEY